LLGKTFDNAPGNLSYIFFFSPCFSNSLVAWWTNAIASIFSAVDKNNNGTISEAEYVNIMTGMVPSVTPDIAKAAFAQVQGDYNSLSFSLLQLKLNLKMKK
jgi:hypothetical protein